MQSALVSLMEMGLYKGALGSRRVPLSLGSYLVFLFERLLLAGESRLFSYSAHLQGFSFDCRIRVSPIVLQAGSVFTKASMTIDVRGALVMFYKRGR